MEELNIVKRQPHLLIIPTLIVIFIISLIFILGGPGTISMTAQEWDVEFDKWEQSVSLGDPDFPSLKPGDIVEINGSISNLTQITNSVVDIELDGYKFPIGFSSDILSYVDIGDQVIITFNITEEPYFSSSGTGVIYGESIDFGGPSDGGGIPASALQKILP